MGGGTEVATLNTAQCLAAFGHDVHIVTSRDEGMPPESADGGVQLHRVYRPNLKSVGAGVFYLAVLNALSSISPQIIHVQDFLLGPCGFFAKRILRRPYIVWGRGYEFRDLTCRTAAVLKDADAVIALTDDMRNELQKICPREIRVISNGIDAERFERVSREDARRQLGIEPAQKIVLYVGRLYPIKGVKYLIAAMQRIRHAEANAKLVLVGYGSDEGNLRLSVKELGLSDCVRFVGAVQNEGNPGIYGCIRRPRFAKPFRRVSNGEFRGHGGFAAYSCNECRGDPVNRRRGDQWISSETARRGSNRRQSLFNSLRSRTKLFHLHK